MSESTLFDTLIGGWLALAGVTFLALSFVAAPYGRHTRRGWGPAIPSKLGWVIMEAPAALVFGACFFVGEETGTVTALVFWIA